MITYVVNPADSSTPTDQQGSRQGAEEFRALKAYIATLSGLTDSGIDNPFSSPQANAIEGGDFGINPWQRGITFAAVANLVYTADRWQYLKAGAAVHTVSKDATNLPTVVQAGKFVNFCLLADVTTANAAPGAGDYSALSHKIEGYNFIPIAQKTMAFQFMSCHTKPGIYCVGFRNSGSDRSYVIEYNHAVADVWQRNIAIIPASPAAGTWDYSNGIGLEVIFTMQAGATFQTAANAWTVGNFFATANQVNSTDNVVNNFRIAVPDLRPGSIVLPAKSRSIQEELDRCLRYCEVWAADVTGGATPVFVDGLPLNTLTMQGVYRFKKPLRSVPATLTVSALGDFTLSNVAGTAVPSAISLNNSTKNSTGIFGTSAGAWTALNQQVYLAANTVNARAIFSADL